MRRGRRDPLGPRGERVAARYLRRRGYRVLGCNLETHFGEADLLCQSRRDRAIVLVEVKARRGSAGPPPEASVTHGKRQRLERILEHLVRTNGWHDRPRRIDVVAIAFERRRWLPARARVRHFEDAVAAGGGTR